ncbi:MAG TPA: rod shape-determining protein MreC [Candidatus Angelobacter sp.]|jgi:rod shape-determining protein MreC|nr:rod shape-determining protein MreC [Candidatus Angelobacter sp.]
METILGRHKNLIVLAAILFAQLIALAVQVKRPTQDGDIRLIRVWAIAGVTPFEKAVVHSQNWVHDKWTGYVWLRGVRRENEELRADMERMKLQQARLSEDANMARRIQTLLAFKEQYIQNTIAAQVIGTSGSEQSRVLYIDKGSDDGIKPDMAVITPTGIVGKIVQVSAGSAQVLPINDQLSGVGAALKETRLQGILKGAPNGTTTLQYIMSDEPVKPGDLVITSGGDRIFPKGLEIGRVASAEPGKDLFLNIRVIPSARLDRLEEVLIITDIQDKLPDTKEFEPIRASDILSQRLPGVPVATGVDAAGNAIPQPGAVGLPAGAVPAGMTASPAGTMTAPGATNPAGTGTAKPAAASPSTNPGASPATAKPARKPPVAAPANGTQAPAAKPKPSEVPPQ